MNRDDSENSFEQLLEETEMDTSEKGDDENTSSSSSEDEEENLTRNVKLLCKRGVLITDSEFEKIANAAKKDKKTPEKRSTPEGFGGKHVQKPPVVYSTATSVGEQEAHEEAIFASLEQQLGGYSSPVVIKNKLYYIDSLTGAPIPHYWHGIPKRALFQRLTHYGEIMDQKKRNAKLKKYPSHDCFLGHFGKLEHLFMYLFWVVGLTQESSIVKDCIQYFYGKRPGWNFESLEKSYKSICNSRLSGGTGNLTIPQQLGHAKSFLRHPGTLFYSWKKEKSMHHNLVNMNDVLPVNNRPGNLSPPTFEFFLASDKLHNARRKQKGEQIKFWQERLREKGEERVALEFAAYKQALKEQKDKKKEQKVKHPASKYSSVEFGFEDDDSSSSSDSDNVDFEIVVKPSAPAKRKRPATTTASSKTKKKAPNTHKKIPLPTLVDEDDESEY